jgi:hypothetical protein
MKRLFGQSLLAQALTAGELLREETSELFSIVQ